MDDQNAQSRKFDQTQYEMLKRCCEKRDFTEWNLWRKKNPKELIKMEGADFKKAVFATGGLKISINDDPLIPANLEYACFAEANLEKACFWGSKIVSADFTKANLKGAKLSQTNIRWASFSSAELNGANFNEARLRDVDFSHSNLQCADFRFAQINGGTKFFGCDFDRKTNFSGTTLDKAVIEPDLKTALRDNIRRIQWKHWLSSGNLAIRSLKFFFVHPFWAITDYGSSTLRICLWFFGLSFVFATIYFGLQINGNPIIKGLNVEGMPIYHTFLRSVYFSVVTMTTLGFGDMYAKSSSYWGHILLIIQVILGYVLLGALITRLGILFTGEAPAIKGPRKYKFPF